MITTAITDSHTAMTTHMGPDLNMDTSTDMRIRAEMGTATVTVTGTVTGTGMRSGSTPTGAISWGRSA